MTKPLDVVILGAGFAGICMAIQLKKSGQRTFALLEKAGALGGTWRDNTYPGAACDVPSLLYSYSFKPRPVWSRLFAPQQEILEYLEACAETHHITPHIRFHTEVESAHFQDKLWHVQTADGDVVRARFLVAGCGQLGQPRLPLIPGRDTFEGNAFHSARWDHDDTLNGNNVAVIGNGASAIQFIPEIAPKTKSTRIFQRSANWVLPKPERIFSRREKLMLRHLPLYARSMRYLVYVLMEARWPAFLQGNPVGRWIERSCTRHLHEQIKDPELRAVLTPDYPAGCKRVLISNNYYPTLLRDNVHVITTPIREITPRGILTEDGTLHEVDTLIYATGFQTTRFLSPIQITGAQGQTLEQAWAGGAEAYRGVAVAGFPNFFILYGPNTNLGHNSIIFMLECEVHYILACLKALQRRGLTTIEPRQEAMARYNQEIQKQLARSVWSADCESWYKNDAGKITNNWSSWTFMFWWHTRKPRLNDFVMG